MKYDLYDVLDSAKADAPPAHRNVDDIVNAGRALHRRRRLTWLASGTAVLAAAAVATAVALPRSAANNGRSDLTAGASGGNQTATFPKLTEPFMYSIKGYDAGKLHVSDPVFATASYQESAIYLDGVKPTRVESNLGKFVREYRTSVGTLTVFRPGVFNPEKFKSGTAVQVRGLPGLQTDFETQIFDRPPAGSSDKPIRPSSHPGKAPALAWQYAENSWATITTNQRFTSEQPAKDLVAIASGLTPGEPSAVKVPYRLPVPAGYHLFAVGSFDPVDSIGDSISTAYFAKGTVPTTGLTGRIDLSAIEGSLLKAGGDIFTVEVEETFPAEPDAPNPHPNLKQPCDVSGSFCDKPINDAYFAEVSRCGNPALLRQVNNNYAFDNPTDRSTWHDAKLLG